MNSSRLACCGFAVLAYTGTGVVSSRADEGAGVPASLQADLLARVVTYDRNMPSRAGARLRIVMVTKPSDDASMRFAAQLQRALGDLDTLGGLPHDETLVPFSNPAAIADLCRHQHIALMYLMPGLEDQVEGLSRALDGVDVLSVSAVANVVPKGIVLGFDKEAGKPKLWVNLSQARRQHVDFRAEVLRLMKVFE